MCLKSSTGRGGGGGESLERSFCRRLLVICLMKREPLFYERTVVECRELGGMCEVELSVEFSVFRSFVGLDKV